MTNVLNVQRILQIVFFHPSPKLLKLQVVTLSTTSTPNSINASNAVPIVTNAPHKAA
jgi:hypothetical protein